MKLWRREWEHQNPPPRDEATWARFGKAVFRKAEKWMDSGFGECWFRDELYAAELQRSILHFHRERYEIGCFVIMANHCHLVLRPFDSVDLEQEIGSMKSVTARFINKREETFGALWQQESYDRIIRDKEHLYRVVQYVGRNPSRAGIPSSQWRRWINPAWKSKGWDFHD